MNGCTGNWVSNTKRHAAKLVVCLMVYLEEHITHEVTTASHLACVCVECVECVCIV